MAGNWNLRSPAVKRILQELREMEREDDPDVVAQAAEDNIFEWHFAIRGAWGTEFEGGIYHGRIIMPAEYPFKPPAFVMLTPSGRFETNMKICLSISSHHPESWQPSWSVRSALIALIAFMQSPGHGALGSLDQPKDARQQLAAASRDKAPTYGNEARQKVISDIHQRMLDMEQRSRQQHAPPPAAEPAQAAQQQQQQQQEEGEPQQEVAGEAAAAVHQPEVQAAAGAPEAAVEAPGLSVAPRAPAVAAPMEGEEGLRQRRAAVPAGVPTAPAAQLAPPQQQPPPPSAAAAPQPQQPLQWQAPVAAAAPGAAQHPPPSFEDRLLTWLAILLVAAILALVARRLLGGVVVGDGGMAGHGLDSQL